MAQSPSGQVHGNAAGKALIDLSDCLAVSFSCSSRNASQCERAAFDSSFLPSHTNHVLPAHTVHRGCTLHATPTDYPRTHPTKTLLSRLSVFVTLARSVRIPAHGHPPYHPPLPHPRCPATAPRFTTRESLNHVPSAVQLRQKLEPRCFQCGLPTYWTLSTPPSLSASTRVRHLAPTWSPDCYTRQP